MSGLAQFTASFCTAAVCLGVLYILVPSGNMSRAVKFAFCVCFLVLTVTAAATLTKTEFNIKTAAQRQETNETSAAAAAAVFKAALNAENIYFTDLKVITSKGADGGIDISEVIVYSTDSAQKIKEIISNDKYYKVSVIGE